MKEFNCLLWASSEAAAVVSAKTSGTGWEPRFRLRGRKFPLFRKFLHANFALRSRLLTPRMVSRTRASRVLIIASKLFPPAPLMADLIYPASIGEPNRLRLLDDLGLAEPSQVKGLPSLAKKSPVLDGHGG